MGNIDIQTMSVKNKNRVIAISDIHGNLGYLKGLLNKLELKQSDCLIFVGDYVEKGSDSLNTLRCIMDLAEAGQAFALKGNCEFYVSKIITDCGDNDRLYLESLIRRKGLIQEMCAREQIVLNKDTDLNMVRWKLLSCYQEEFEFLFTRPVIIDTGEYVFVHAGLQSEELKDQDARLCMKCDHFMDNGLFFSKYCVVGHWPVVLYHRDRPMANPLVDEIHKIISIDGGCVLNGDGQLNALILSGEEHKDISWEYYDDYPLKTVTERQEAGGWSSFNLPWIDNEVKVIKREEEFSYCRHVTTGYELWILNRYLYEEEGSILSNGCTDYKLGVEAGDVVSVIEETGRGWLIKKDGCTGWYSGNLV